MTAEMTVTQLFKEAGLLPCGPVLWGKPLTESGSGIYAVSLVADPDSRCDSIDIGYLTAIEVAKWLEGQPVIYIGRTRRPLRRRVAEFYRHKYGNSTPHRGGQAVKLIAQDLWVFWAPTERPIQAENAMIAAFVRHAGKLPFANRRR